MAATNREGPGAMRIYMSVRVSKAAAFSLGVAAFRQAAWVRVNVFRTGADLRSEFHRHVGPLGGACIQLARPADALRGIVDHRLPLRDPARRAGDGIDHCEHFRREAERLRLRRR
jgi:hypothetical protein